jgi:hypothetical protein
VSPFPRKLRWFVAATCAATLCVAGLAAFLTGWPTPGALALLGALALFSAQRDVLLPNGISLSPGLMICMAAVVVFRDEPSWLGPLMVGAAAAVYFPSFTKSSWGWIPFNASLSGLAYFAAGATFRLFPESGDLATWQLVVAAVPCVIASLAVAWSLLLLSYIVEGARPWREVLGELLPTAFDSVPFAIMGFLLGRLYLGLGPAVLVLVIVPILIAREVFASYMRVREAHDETVQLLIRALEQKDPYTAGHAGRVAVYAGYIADELDFMPARAERLRFAALMHDIGKLVVPNQLLNKPGKLTEEEFRRVRIHEQVSVQMLSHIDFLRPIAGHGHSDAMRFNPDDTDHPIEPYIIMVADAFDAMTSTRSYRKALPQEIAFQELRDKSGTQFHPEAAAALIRALEKRHETHGAGHEETTHFEDAPDSGLGSAGLGDLIAEEKAPR